MSVYKADFCGKGKRKPATQLPLRPSSASRRNNPHPPRDFPDTQVLQELRKDYTNETVILAKAKEQALSKATWLDELMAEKEKPNASRKTKDVNSAEYRHVIAKMLSVNHAEQLRSDSNFKGYLHGYKINMADHFA